MNSENSRAYNVETRQAMIDYIDASGITCPILIQIELNISFAMTQKYLHEMELLRLIARPVKGLVLSKRYISENPDEYIRIQKALGLIFSEKG